MAIQASQLNLRKKYQWSLVTDDGVEVALFERCKLPDAELEVSEHGGGGTVWNSKEAGRYVFGPCELTKAVKAAGGDTWGWDWLTKAINPKTGIGLPPAGYQKDITIVEFNPEGDVKDSWTLKNAWVSKVEPEEYDGKSSDNMLRKVTIQCDYPEHT